jgi:hypothetical protein
MTKERWAYIKALRPRGYFFEMPVVQQKGAGRNGVKQKLRVGARKDWPVLPAHRFSYD